MVRAEITGYYAVQSVDDYGSGHGLDVYEICNQKNPPNNPVFIYLHPGGWSSVYSGDRKDDAREAFITKLTQFGITVIIPNYTLSDENAIFVDGFTTLTDINEVVTYAKNTLHYNTVSIGGYSAGAHLALIYSMRYPNRVDKVVSIAGPTNLFNAPQGASTQDNRDLFENLVEDFANNGTDNRLQLSPNSAGVIPYSNNSSYLLLYNYYDDMVNFTTQGTAFYNLLVSNNFDAKFVNITDYIYKHDFAHKPYRQPSVLFQIKKFLLEGLLLAGPPPSSIYYIENYLKRWIPDPETYLGCGFSWDDFITIEQSKIDEINSGSYYNCDY